MSLKSFNLKISHKILSFKKNISVDPDKSLSIRSFLIGAISNNISTINNVLESEDVFSTIKCLKKLKVKIKKKRKKKYLVFGKGLGSLAAKKNIKLNFGNSGTLARLLIGILSTTPNVTIKVLGDKSLNKRSMKKLIKLMEMFGASFLPKNKFNFPLKIVSSKIPIGIEYKAGVSAQLKSAVIFAGLNSWGDTEIIEKEKSRDHTENMLLKNQSVIKIQNGKERIIKISGKKYLKSSSVSISGDPSSAAFFSALTILNPMSSLEIKKTGLNSTRTGFYKLLQKHGAKIKFKNLKKNNNEISGDIIIKSSKIKPLFASRKFYVNSTDEYPILFVIAALTKGCSKFYGIKDLANKESNRILEMQKVLNQIGIKSIASRNEFKIFGKGMVNYKDRKIKVPDLGDHRICMATFILAILTGAKTTIKSFETVNTSTPSFLKIMKKLGAKFEIQ